MSVLPWFTPVYQHLTGRLLASKLHHGLLLTGPAGIGKDLLASELAKTLLCRQVDEMGYCGQCHSCQVFEAGTHPDFISLVSEKQLGVDKIREGITSLNATAQFSGNKVLVIPEADKMTESAANALLKTLEEPTPNTFLMLITDRPQQLLATIISRCEKHVLARPSSEMALQWLHQQGVHDATEALLHAYSDAPLDLKAALEQGEGLSYREYADGLDNLLAGQVDAVTLATQWQDSAGRVIGWLQQYARAQYTETLQTEHFHLFEACSQVQRTLLNSGVNKIMLLSSLLAEVKRPVKP